jgi:hypothetical protein
MIAFLKNKFLHIVLTLIVGISFGYLFIKQRIENKPPYIKTADTFPTNTKIYLQYDTTLTKLLSDTSSNFRKTLDKLYKQDTETKPVSKKTKTKTK